MCTFHLFCLYVVDLKCGSCLFQSYCLVQMHFWSENLSIINFTSVLNICHIVLQNEASKPNSPILPEGASPLIVDSGPLSGPLQIQTEAQAEVIAEQTIGKGTLHKRSCCIKVMLHFFNFLLHISCDSAYTCIFIFLNIFYCHAAYL